MLRIENLTKTYGGKKAVDDLSLHIKAGEICAFIGHNGAGKTTTLKACCGILRFNSGEIFINNSSIKEYPIACKKNLAYIPDNPDMYEFMPGIKYLNFIADIYGVSGEERERLTSEYAEMFGISGDLNQPISEFSHGMKQKLALTAALIHSPKLIVMDEPFVGLDPVSTHQLKDLMHKLCDEGAAIFFSTHVLEVAEKLCDRVAIIRRGRLVVDGDMDTVRGDTSLEEVFLELEEKND